MSEMYNPRHLVMVILILLALMHFRDRKRTTLVLIMIIIIAPEHADNKMQNSSIGLKVKEPRGASRQNASFIGDQSFHAPGVKFPTHSLLHILGS